MAKQIIGCGWAFPPQVSQQGGMALTSERNEIDQAIHALVAATPVPRRVAPLVVPAALAQERLDERPLGSHLRDLLKGGDRLVPKGRCGRLEPLDCHDRKTPGSPCDYV